MAKKNKKSFSPILLILILLTIVIIYLYNNKDNCPPVVSNIAQEIYNLVAKTKKIFNPTKDLTPDSLKIDQAVIKALNRLEIQDSDLVEEFREEKEQDGKKWIQTNRKIIVNNGKLLEEYQMQITKEVSKLEGQVTGEISQNEQNIQLTLNISFFEKIFQKLILIQKKTSVKKN